MRVVFCGFGRTGLECLTQLMAVTGIRTQDLLVFTHDNPQNQLFLDTVKGLGITCHTRSVNRCIDELERFQGDLLLSVYYRNIIRENILSLFIECHGDHTRW